VLHVPRSFALAGLGLALVAAGAAAYFTLLQPAEGAPTVARLGAAAPQISLSVVGGGTSNLAAERGKVVLVNFWATWCPACRRELSTVESTFRLLRHRGVEVVGIDKQENASSVAAFARRSGVTYPVAVDSDGSIAGRYFLPYLPDTFLIGPDGRVVAESHGAITVSWVRQHVLPLIAQ